MTQLDCLIRGNGPWGRTSNQANRQGLWSIEESDDSIDPQSIKVASAVPIKIVSQRAWRIAGGRAIAAQILAGPERRRVSQTSALFWKQP